jgi:FGGY-family pentulose kinase
MKNYLLGIDVGTQSLRVGIFDLQGKSLAFSSKSYETYYPHVSWAEQNPMDWWACAKVCTREVLKKADISPDDIAGISIDTFSCTVLPVDENGTPLHNAVIWMDIRAVKEAEEITATGHPYLKYAGDWVSPEWMIPKALWFKRHKPDIYKKSAKFIECTDWMTYKLTGKWTLSLDHIASKWNYVKSEGGFPQDLMEKVGLEDLMEKWPKEIKALGEYVGGLTKQAAEELGLKEGTPVAQGGIDAHLGMIGLGAVETGDMALIMGSSTCHMALSPIPVFGSGVWGPFDEAIIPGNWVLEGGQTSTGSIVKWFKDNFAYKEEMEAQEKSVSVYTLLDEKASQIPPGSEGLVLLDYFQGNRSPLRDPKARGAIWGLGLKHRGEHILRAIYEGTAYGTRLILEALKEKNFTVEKIYAGGGGAQSKLWLKIHADVCQTPIILTEDTESMALGAAMCAAVGAGIYKDFKEAAKNMVKVKTKIMPDLANKDAYDFYFDKYKRTYEHLKDLMHEMYERA